MRRKTPPRPGSFIVVDQPGGPGKLIQCVETDFSIKTFASNVSTTVAIIASRWQNYLIVSGNFQPFFCGEISSAHLDRFAERDRRHAILKWLATEAVPHVSRHFIRCRMPQQELQLLARKFRIDGCITLVEKIESFANSELAAIKTLGKNLGPRQQKELWRLVRRAVRKAAVNVTSKSGVSAACFATQVKKKPAGKILLRTICRVLELLALPPVVAVYRPGIPYRKLLSTANQALDTERVWLKAGVIGLIKAIRDYQPEPSLARDVAYDG